MQKFIVTISASLALLLSGCGSEESNSCRLDVQQNMDQGNFDAVIADLNQTSCQEEFDGEEYRITLAAAYMNESNMTFTSVVSDMTSLSGGDAFAQFSSKIAEKGKSKATRINLQRAQKEYLAYLGDIDCTDKIQTQQLSYAQKDVCLFKSMTDTLVATLDITSLTTNVAEWFDPTVNVTDENDRNNDQIPDDVNGNSCALKYTQANFTSCKENYDVKNKPIEGVSLKSEGNVALQDITFNTSTTYELIETSVTDDGTNTNTYASLIYPANATTGRYKVLTQGFQTVDGSECEAYEAGTCYPSPIFNPQTNQPVSYNDSIVKNMNDGLDGTSAVTTDESIKQSIDDFKKDFRKDDPEKQLEISDFITYLDKPKN